MSKNKTIVVFGATGAQGGAVVDALLESNAWGVRGITRNLDSDEAQKLAKRGVELMRGDVSWSVEDLQPLFDGAYGCFVLTNYFDQSSMGKEEEQGRNLIDAAKRANIQHFIYSALPNVKKLSSGRYDVPHFTDKAEVAEYAFKQEFPFLTMYSAGFYYQNLRTLFAPKKEDDGTLVFTLPKTSNITMMDVKDTGPVVAAILSHPDHVNRQWVAAQGYDGTLQNVFDILSRAIGEKVRLVEMPREEYAQLGFDCAKEVSEMFGWFDEYTIFGPEIDKNSGKKLHPNMTSFETWARTSWKQQE